MGVGEIIRCLQELIKANAPDVGLVASDFALQTENKLKAPMAEARHGLIKEVFEADIKPTAMNPYVRIYQEIRRHPDKPPPSLTGRYGKESTPDFFACYIPECEAAYYYGIYFNGSRFVKAVASRGLPVDLLVRAVAVHELFHAFVEMVLGDDVCAHSHSGEKVNYCRLEEAAANHAAQNWLLSQKVLRSNDVTSIDEFLFFWAERQSPPVPGYGEFSLVDETAPELVPRLVAAGQCDPAAYRQSSVLGRADSSRHSQDDQPFLVTRQRDSLVWQAIVDNLDSENVPCYVDLH
jgi:hypothetical protein